jgi:hypothetical protein
MVSIVNRFFGRVLLLVAVGLPSSPEGGLTGILFGSDCDDCMATFSLLLSLLVIDVDLEAVVMDVVEAALASTMVDISNIQTKTRGQ